MAFILFVAITIVLLIIGCLVAGLVYLHLLQIRDVKTKWPKLSKSELILRRQTSHGYAMANDLQNIYQYYQQLFLFASMMIMLGISIGGFLIANLNLTLVPLIIICIELALFCLVNLSRPQRINEQYKKYIRSHLDNELKVVTIPETVLKLGWKIKLVLSVTLLILTILLSLATLMINHMI